MNEAVALIEIVEGIKATTEHGTWRDEHGRRLKDTPEWRAFYAQVRDAETRASTSSDTCLGCGEPNPRGLFCVACEG